MLDFGTSKSCTCMQLQREPFAVNPMVLLFSPVCNSGPAGSVDEDSFFSAFEEVPTQTVSSFQITLQVIKVVNFEKFNEKLTTAGYLTKDLQTKKKPKGVCQHRTTCR